MSCILRGQALAERKSLFHDNKTVVDKEPIDYDLT